MNWICWLSVLFQCFCLGTENFVNVIIEFFDIFLPKTVLSQRNRTFPLICFISVMFLHSRGSFTGGSDMMTRESTLRFRNKVFERVLQQVADVCCAIPCSVFVWKRMPFDLSTKFLSLK